MVGITSRLLLGAETVVLVDVGSLPRVADPDVPNGAGRVVATVGVHVVGKNTLLGLVLVLFCGCVSDIL